MLGSAARLGAIHAVVDGDEPDHAILADLFGRLCEFGSARGLTMNLGFTRWTGVRTLADATRVVAASGRPEGRVLAVLPPEIPLSLEAPARRLAQTLSAPERARCARAAVASLLAEIG